MNENDWKCRTELLLGATNINRLLNAHVCIAGLGGVGGYAAEQLCRAGVGHLTLIDCDSVQLSNLNRQIIASQTTLGKLKTSLFNERLKDINPNVKIEILNVFLGDKNISSILSGPLNTCSMPLIH
jgi:tRNA A37 threonylcarbamoyladenosine dehydratase